MRTVLLFSMLISSVLVSAQGLIENNNAADKAKNGIKSEKGIYVMPNGDSCLTWIQEFDVNGRLTKYIDHFQCGKKYIEYEYRYHEDGSLRKAWISHHSTNFQKVEMEMKLDENQQVIELAPSVEIKGHPYAERYEYDMAGKVSKAIRMKKDIFSFLVDSEKVWDGDKFYTLVPRAELYEDNGSLRWITLRTVEKY